jgi:hypothetical protein
LSQLTAITMLANQYGDHSVLQLVSIVRLTILFQHFNVLEENRLSVNDVHDALKAAETVVGLVGFESDRTATGTGTTNGGSSTNASANTVTGGAQVTPSGPFNGETVQDSITPLLRDMLASGGVNVGATLRTPAFAFPVNPLGMDVYSVQNGSTATSINPALLSNPTTSADVQHTNTNINVSSTSNPDQSANPNPNPNSNSNETIPPYLCYLRVQILMLSVLWLTHCGESTKSAERLTLLHEMMDRLSEFTQEAGWGSHSGPGIVEVGLTLILKGGV